jgi:phenylpropionate dioxygenase-like ring-hydroxylating dioxygenase large terminal subunit
MKEAWYPVGRSSALPPGGLLSFELFGEPLVCFRDSRGQPVCLQDRCPHRSTPLSQGRVVGGRLECRYHGWQFGAAGRCERIPVLTIGKSPPPRANACGRICQERRGMIWVWAGALDRPPGEFPEYLFETLDSPGMAHYIFDQAMDIPHNAMVENFLDPAHIPFTHHGTMSVRSAAQPIRFELLPDPHAALAARAHYQYQPAMVSIAKFYSPCVVTLDMRRSMGRGMRAYQMHFCVPSSRDRMHIFTCFASNVLGWVLRVRWALPLFRWAAGRVLAQDLGMLRGQQHNVARGAAELHQPTISDSLTVRYRKWLKDALPPDAWFTGFDDERGGRQAGSGPLA